MPTPAPTTARVFLELLFAQAQRPVKVLRLGATTARAIGLTWPVAREGAEMLYQFRQPHSVDATAYRTAFGSDTRNRGEGRERCFSSSAGARNSSR